MDKTNPALPSLRRDQRGYSLIETVVVMAVTGIALALSAPMVRVDPQTHSVRAAKDIEADIGVVRMRALSRQEPTTLRVSDDGRSYLLIPGNITRELPEGTTIVPIGGTAPPVVAFATTGTLAIPQSVSFGVASHDHSALVTVSPIGQVQIEVMKP